MAATQVRATQLLDGTLTDQQINASAAIALSKLSENVIQADGGQAFTADQSMGSNKLTNVANGTNANDAVNKGQLDAAISGLDIQADVLGVQQDANLDPGASPTAGDRYVITDSSSLHANFGTITGLSNNDIVIYDGTSFVVIYPVSAYGSGALVWDRDSGTWQSYDGSSWNEFGGLAGVTAGSGLSKTGHTINVGAATNGGIQVNADDIGILLDGATLSLGASGLSISGEGVGTAQLAGTSVTAAKLGSDVAGNGLTGGNGSALAVQADGGTLTVGGSGVKVSDLGIGTGQLADDSVTVAKIGSITTEGQVIRVGASGPQASTPVDMETPSGTVNGTNATFTLANTPIAGTVKVFLNGVRMEPGAGNDFTRSGDTLTMLTTSIPVSGDKLRVDYEY